MKLRLNFIVGFLFSVLGAYGNAQFLSVQLNDEEGNPISDAVIEILLPDEMRSEYQSKADATVDQRDKEFVPNMLTIVSGNSVSFQIAMTFFIMFTRFRQPSHLIFRCTAKERLTSIVRHLTQLVLLR